IPFGQLWWCKLTNATLSVTANGLQVSNLGASGQDGVAMGLNELSRTATLKFVPVELGGTEAGLAFTLTGMVNDVPGQSFGKLSLQRQGSGVDLAFDAGPTPVAASLRLEVYHQNSLVGSAVLPAGGSLGTLSGTVR